MHRDVAATPDFSRFCSSLIGLPLSRIWQGYGSAIFLEFGDVQPRRRRDGSPGNPRGQWTLRIEWSWRIENSYTRAGLFEGVSAESGLGAPVLV